MACQDWSLTPFFALHPHILTLYCFQSGQLETKVVPVDKIVEAMKQKHSQAQAHRTVVSQDKQKHENFEYNLVTQINEDGGVNAHKLVKEKMVAGNSQGNKKGDKKGDASIFSIINSIEFENASDGVEFHVKNN